MIIRKLPDGFWQCRGVYRGCPFDCRDKDRDQAFTDATAFMFEVRKGLV